MDHQRLDGRPLVVTQSGRRASQLFEDRLRVVAGRHGLMVPVRSDEAAATGALLRRRCGVSPLHAGWAPSLRGECPQLPLDLQRDVDELVLLATDELALARPVQ